MQSFVQNFAPEADVSDTQIVFRYYIHEGTPGGDNSGITELPDLTPNGNHGTLTNFTLTGSTSNWVSSTAPLSTFSTVPVNMPKTPQLKQNYPNPFNPTTQISYILPRAGFVTLKIYNILGMEVQILVSRFQPADQYSVNFDGSLLSNGVYFYQLQVGSFTETRKMILMK